MNRNIKSYSAGISVDLLLTQQSVAVEAQPPTVQIHELSSSSSFRSHHVGLTQHLRHSQHGAATFR